MHYSQIQRLFWISLILAGVFPNCQKQQTPKNYYTEVINIEKPLPKGSSVQLRTSPGLNDTVTSILNEKKIKIDSKSNLVVLLEKSSLTMQFKLIEINSNQVLYALSCEIRESDDLEFAIGYALDQIQKANGQTKQFGQASQPPTVTAKTLSAPTKTKTDDPLAPGSGSDDFSEETVE